MMHHLEDPDTFKFFALQNPKANPRQDRMLANTIADEVGRALKDNQPKDTFRRSESQIWGNAARQLQRDGRRQGRSEIGFTAKCRLEDEGPRSGYTWT